MKLPKIRATRAGAKLRSLLATTLCSIALLLCACEDGGESFRRSLRKAAGAVDSPERSQQRATLRSEPNAKAVVEGPIEDNNTEKGAPSDNSTQIIGSPEQKAALQAYQMHCEPGSRLNGAPPPKSRALWCEKKSENGSIVRHGTYLQWHRNKAVNTRAEYRNGKLHGEFESYYRNGDLQESRRYAQGSLHGPVIRYSPQGHKVKEVHYYLGEKHGRFAKWNRNGTPREEGEYQRDQAHGSIKRFYRSGQLRSVTEYRAGKKHGTFKEYSKEGRLTVHGAFSEGQKSGRWQSYGQNGRVRSMGNYEADKKEGLWIEYGRNGRIREQQHYASGRPVSRQRAVQHSQHEQQEQGWQPL